MFLHSDLFGISDVDPKTDPALMRASLSARLGQEKPHETQTPQPRADHSQAAQCRATAQPRTNSCRCMPSPGGICCHLPPLAASLRRHVDEVGRRPKATEAKRLKELEQENSRLKSLFAEAELDKAMLKELDAP